MMSEANRLTADALLDMSSGALDTLFRSSVPGPIPVGEMRGTVLFAPGTLFAHIFAPLVRLFCWQGKVFDPVREQLQNRISLLRFRAIRANVYLGDSWLDGQKTIVLDYSRTSTVAGMIRDEIREVAPGLYLGIVFWGRKHVLDFCLAVGAENR